MTNKTFKYVSALIGAVSTAGVASVTYFVEDTTIAAAVNGFITAMTTATVALIGSFVKE